MAERRTATGTRWSLGWGVVAVLVVAGLAGTFTIGVYVLPVAVVVALVLVGVAARRASAPAPTGRVPAPTIAPGASNQLATISLLTGIASMIVMPPMAIAGTVTGVLALVEIRRSGGAQTGTGKAVAGIAASICGVVVAAFLVSRVNAGR